VEEIDGTIEGPATLERDAALKGQVIGDLTVPEGVRLELYGQVNGDLVVQPGAAVIVHGRVIGAVRNQGGYVSVLGAVGSISDTGDQPTHIGPNAMVGPCAHPSHTQLP
jgi:hypothetical protein